MRKTLLLLALVSFAATIAVAQSTPALTFRNDNRVVLTDCPADGGATSAVSRGKYLFRVTDADATVCTYTDGGSGCPGLYTSADKFSKDTVLLYRVPPAGQSFSCRSADGGADVSFTRVDTDYGP